MNEEINYKKVMQEKINFIEDNKHILTGKGIIYFENLKLRINDLLSICSLDYSKVNNHLEEIKELILESIYKNIQIEKNKNN